MGNMLPNEDVKQKMGQHLYDYRSEQQLNHIHVKLTGQQLKLLFFNSVLKIPVIAQTEPIWNNLFNVPEEEFLSEYYYSEILTDVLTEMDILSSIVCLDNNKVCTELNSSAIYGVLDGVADLFNTSWSCEAVS